MSKHSLSGIFKSVRTAVKKHSPEILTGIGIAGMITAAVMAVKATPKALTLIEKKKNEMDTNELKTVDTVKAAWPCYIPAAVVGSISVACLIGASSTNLRRNTALATAYTLSESTLKEYQEKVVEIVGKKKEQAMQDLWVTRTSSFIIYHRKLLMEVPIVSLEKHIMLLTPMYMTLLLRGTKRASRS